MWLPAETWPVSLTLLRLLLGPLMLWQVEMSTPRSWLALGLLAGLLSDYFDGVVARRLGVAHAWLRRLDSTVDVAFYLCILVLAYRLAPHTLRAAWPGLAALVAGEALCMGTSLVRFGTLPATHSLAAKLYGLLLFLAALAVLWLDAGAWVLWLLTLAGCYANGEILAILLLSPQAPVDVRTLASLLRQRGAGAEPS